MSLGVKLCIITEHLRRKGIVNVTNTEEFFRSLSQDFVMCLKLCGLGHFEPNAQNVMVRNIYLAFPLVLVNNN